MPKRKADDAAPLAKTDKEFGPESNGADADGIKENNEADDAKDVERTDKHCNSYCEGDDNDDDDDCQYDGDDGTENVVIDYKKGQRELTKYICSTGLPDIVSLVKNLCPSFPLDLPSIRGDCLQIYEKDKLRVKHILRNMDGQISLSVDVLRYYTCSGSDSVFMCLAAHFIDDRWKLKKWVIGFRRLWFKKGGILHSATLETVKDWDIESKISSLTLAESHLYDEMVEEIKESVQQKKKLQLDGKLFCVKCCAEMFNLMAKDAYKEITDIINKVSLLISWKFAPVWYLKACKLKEALELNAMDEFSPEKVSDFYDVPSADEWEKVKCICKLVESAEAIARSIFDTKYPTANIFLFNLEELRAILFQESISSDSFTSKVAKKMLQTLDKYLEDMFFVLSIASVMDPRHKMRYIDYLSSKREVHDGKSRSALVLDAISSLYIDYVNQDFEKEKSVSDSTSSDSEEELTRSTERGGSKNSNWLEEYNQFTESNNKPPKSDLDRYLEEPVLSWTQDFNVLKWWRAESPKYPILSKMARDFLAIPMSVATSDEAFSTTPREVETRIMASGPALRNALMCTRTWDLED
ncbi:zinc finger BED domain-containing protein RICESLEEPER 1-like [Rhododendron vialii]|uniref:zinc finger BED domain-containing protein RICESLEEPER 1-like n=1 Tax=Rhododendron vialii TaxID=182163 RepID=UPI00265FA38D|nr:zinc finger BED domain-containing protein RICESLEEPER 1-like [Rhododendron vialii]XP_058210258.1 zinc finger BED domain-containing protein RICESLEEPER 1-like [Rhododendron vialii]XP_058210259.1 zinc finger BED domain-containing protein RICESLEEPER 1-like [Rhododendron vialii]XP_058210260.1 zinc finger BED domain-containing protein RICESLEEPER 1-like [Rhododendron vialii]XP_058210261.1 zinc finger BED domain-containing protein RICESLEEPER 1-like [Rhododendron vialii]